MNERDLPKNHPAFNPPQHTYSVGDHVTYGFNGDYNPGIVVRVTNASVWVKDAQLDTSAVPQDKRYYGRTYHEGEPGVVFVLPSETAKAKQFKVLHGRKWRGAVVHGGWQTLSHGASAGRNPHI